jgi:hypothetical protein
MVDSRRREVVEQKQLVDFELASLLDHKDVDRVFVDWLEKKHVQITVNHSHSFHLQLSHQ